MKETFDYFELFSKISFRELIETFTVWWKLLEVNFDFRNFADLGTSLSAKRFFSFEIFCGNHLWQPLSNKRILRNPSIERNAWSALSYSKGAIIYSVLNRSRYGRVRENRKSNISPHFSDISWTHRISLLFSKISLNPIGNQHMNAPNSHILQKFP